MNILILGVGMQVGIPWNQLSSIVLRSIYYILSFTQKPTTVVYHTLALPEYIVKQTETNQTTKTQNKYQVSDVYAPLNCVTFHVDIFAFVLTFATAYPADPHFSRPRNNARRYGNITRKVHWPTPGLWHACCVINHRPLCGWCPGSTIPDRISVGEASFPRNSDATFKYLHCISISFVKTPPCHMVRTKQ